MGAFGGAAFLRRQDDLQIIGLPQRDQFREGFIVRDPVNCSRLLEYVLNQLVSQIILFLQRGPDAGAFGLN